MIKKVIDLLHEAWKVAMKYHQQTLDITYAGGDPYYPITQADIEIDSLLRAWVNKILKAQILSQEHDDKDIDYSWDVWMIDAIDGTKDFIWWSGKFSHMISLCRKGIPVLWVAYLPFFETIYYAQKWSWAYMIQKWWKPEKLSVSNVTSITESRCIGKSQFSERRETFNSIQKSLWWNELLVWGTIGKTVWDIASGNADIYFFTNPRWGKRDICWNQVILEEAWWKVTDRYGKPIDYTSPWYMLDNLFIASNWYLHNDAVRIFWKIVD